MGPSPLSNFGMGPWSAEMNCINHDQITLVTSKDWYALRNVLSGNVQDDPDCSSRGEWEVAVHLTLGALESVDILCDDSGREIAPVGTSSKMR